MWVRSQSKRTLMNCKYFTVDSTNVVIGMAGNNYTSVGSYSTEEKALKVLDMIEQAKIQQRKGDLLNLLVACKYVVVDSLDNLIFDDKNIVFQMPQDSEV